MGALKDTARHVSSGAMWLYISTWNASVPGAAHPCNSSSSVFLILAILIGYRGITLWLKWLMHWSAFCIYPLAIWMSFVTYVFMFCHVLTGCLFLRDLWEFSFWSALFSVCWTILWLTVLRQICIANVLSKFVACFFYSLNSVSRGQVFLMHCCVSSAPYHTWHIVGPQ